MPLPKKKILVVDDSPTSLRFVSDTLSEAGYEVATARDGEEAVKQVNACAPDGVILDILLPKKNGFQVCRELKTDPTTKAVRIILLSSKSQETDRFWGQRQGADAYVTKPVNAPELTAIVHAVLCDGNEDESTYPSRPTFPAIPNPSNVVSENTQYE